MHNSGVEMGLSKLFCLKEDVCIYLVVSISYFALIALAAGWSSNLQFMKTQLQLKKASQSKGPVSMKEMSYLIFQNIFYLCSE